MINIAKETYERIISSCRTPVFVYSEPTLKKNIERIRDAIRHSDLDNQVIISAAYFTNSNPHLFKILEGLRIGATLQSTEEFYQLEKHGLDNIEKIVSSTALSDEDLEFFIGKGLLMNAALPDEIEYILQKTDKFGLRIDLSPEQNQRTGLKISEFAKIEKILGKSNNGLFAIHTYPGTNSEYDKLVRHAEETFKAYKKYFPQVKEINLGGGFAFDYDAKDALEKHFPWNNYFYKLKDLAIRYSIPGNVRISIEPGREIFADIGEFIIKVNRVHKRPHDEIMRIYTDGSYAHMPSATLKQRQHQLRFLDRDFNEITDQTNFGELSGCTSLSNDFIFPGIIQVPESLSKGDYILIQDIGAYGATQHMEFLNKRPATEILVRKEGIVEIISERGSYADKVRNVPLNPRRIETPRIIRGI